MGELAAHTMLARLTGDRLSRGANPEVDGAATASASVPTAVRQRPMEQPQR